MSKSGVIQPSSDIRATALAIAWDAASSAIIVGTANNSPEEAKKRAALAAEIASALIVATHDSALREAARPSPKS